MNPSANHNGAHHEPREPAAPPPGGYRPAVGNGPQVRTDIVDLYVAKLRGGPLSTREGGDPEWAFLQLLRASKPMLGTWQPVMGHIESGETAIEAVVREATEEIGLNLRDRLVCEGVWALEQVHPFYIPAIDCIVMSPRFVAVVREDWRPRLNDEHSAWRWVPSSMAWRQFMWPGQMAALRETMEMLDNHGPGREAMRVAL